jgi:zinc transport system ATP-binding protein
MKEKKEIVRIKDVWFDYDGVTVLENISLSIKEHDFLGIIGPNGGGKTTLLKIMLGLLSPSKGEVTVFGGEPFQTRRDIGYVSQGGPFDNEFPINVWDAVLMGRLSHTGLFKRYREKDEEAVHEALETVEILGLRERPIGRLSGGERQRVFIARALASEPRLLLLDEPTSHVDVQMQAGIYDLLEKLHKKVTIVLVSHDTGTIYSHVEKIACLNRQLFYHDAKEITIKSLEEVYHHCPVEMIAHGIPHRVLKEHKHK